MARAESAAPVREAPIHRPVLLKEVVDLIGVVEGGRYVDCTVGSGGHTEALLQRLGPGGRVLGFDRDGAAVERALQRLAPWGGQCQIVQANFSDLADVTHRMGWQQVDGILFDLGMSSDQLDDPRRGFSFQTEGPLDMRMDQNQPETAASWIAESGEAELVEIFRRLGEERKARRIAQVIVRERQAHPIVTTAQLAELITRAVGGRHGKIHPATRAFMALRMAVNRELENIRAGLDAALNLVRPGGRVGVISFHSVEDRVVKRSLAAHVGRWESQPAGGTRWVGQVPAAKWITRKPVTPGAEELAENPRSRSAKLRVVERTE